MISELTRQQLTLQQRLEDRKFAANGIEYVPALSQLEAMIVSQQLDPRDDWRLGTRELEKDTYRNAQQAIRDHWLSAYHQVAYFQYLLHEGQSKRRQIDHPKKQMLHDNQLLMSLSETLAWGHYHWAFAEDFFGISVRIYGERARTGGQAKADRYEENQAILRCLIKLQLEHHPPSEKGWPDPNEASEQLAEAVERLVKEQHFPIKPCGEDLVWEIFNLLMDNKSVNKVYEECRKPKRGRRR